MARVPFLDANEHPELNDIVARIVAQRRSEAFQQSVVVDNRAGAGGRTRAVNRVPACGM